ncbi:hypothetical protein ABN034_32500 [Actinopolymorpha sp. B11F2]|uniref:hypothetical protein n=1 Tax=Actinopolymorpha sp. B11F2 TaxID=3160862 RepID=UPI0032E38D47
MARGEGRCVRDVGDLEFADESVDMISEPGLTLTIYAAEPASPTAHAPDLLASWATTSNETTTSTTDSAIIADRTKPACTSAVWGQTREAHPTTDVWAP